MEQNELEIAVENNDFVGIQVAVKSCADINIQNTEGNTALHLAISKSCDFDMLKLLLSNGADVTVKNKEGYSPLQLIDPESHETFLNLFRLEQYINYSGGVGNTIMHLLLMTDTANISLWNTIIEEFPTLYIDFNAQNVLGHTPLHIAAARIMGIEDLQFILNNVDGLNIFLTDKKGNSFLQTFVANMMSQDYHTSFLTQLLQGNLKYCTTADIKMLLCHKNKNGYTPLHLYVNESEEVSVDILNVFVNSGAQMNSDNVFGENILHALVRSFPDNAEAIDYALEHGGNANVKNAFGESPIFFTDSIDAVQILLKANADLSIRNKVGKTPLMSMILRSQVKFDLIETLIKNGANINEVDNYGNTVLLFAAWNGVDEDIINLLKENGVKSVPDSMGYFPCQVAQKMGHLSSVKNICICENGSDAHLHALEGVSFSKEIIHWNELIQRNAVEKQSVSLQTRARFFNDNDLYDILRKPGTGSVEFGKESKLVKDAVSTVIPNICQEIGNHDIVLENTVIQSGSVGENTKVGLPDEFDYVCLIDIFSKICEVDEEATIEDPGYVYVKLKQEFCAMDQYRHLFNTHGYLDTEGLRQRFVSVLADAIQNPAVCCHSNIIMELSRFKHSQMAPNCQLTLRWTSCEYKNIEINIDLVPACRIIGWWPSHAKLDLLAFNSEEARKEGAILLLQTTFDEDFEQVTYKLRVSALSAEKIHMQSLPQIYRDVYMISKILIDDKVCPRVNLSTEREESFLRTNISSYMFKNCLFNIIEDEIELRTISNKTKPEAAQSQTLHGCVCKLFRKFQKCIEDEKLPSFIFPWQDVFTFQDKDHDIFPGQNHMNCTCRSVYTKVILILLGQEEIFEDVDTTAITNS